MMGGGREEGVPVLEGVDQDVEHVCGEEREAEGCEEGEEAEGSGVEFCVVIIPGPCGG